jgi:hypothetical protein
LENTKETAMKKWLDIVRGLVPFIINLINPALAPLGSAIATGITEAEGFAGASGPEKLAHAQNIATAAATAINTASGKVVIDVAGLNEAVKDGINTSVAVANLLTRTPTATT